MTDQSRPQLTDTFIERMLIERAGHRAPADLVDSIAQAIESTSQRAPGLFGARRVTRRFPTMNMPARFAVAAVVCVLVVGGTFYLLRPGQPAVGTPSPMPSVNATPSQSALPSAVPSPTVVPARAPSWTAIETTIDSGSPAARLLDGRVLWTGGNPWDYQGCRCRAYLYDPASDSWTATGNMIESGGQTTALLLDGKVLVAGGGPTGTSAELYDPVTGIWTATGSMGAKRYGFTAAQLPDGRVLVLGGDSESDGSNRHLVISAEVYDPATGSWTATGNAIEKGMVAATLLPNGKVLALGGADGHAALYDPATGSWTATGSMRVKRQGFTATKLPDGKVLVAGGVTGSAGGAPPLASAELYDPGTGSWTPTGRMAIARKWFTATLLLNGKVLVAGGWNYQGSAIWAPPRESELYDPSTGTWTATANVITARAGADAILLLDGRVIVEGGDGGDNVGALISAELYDPGSP